jgi:hypothetical protein
MPRAKYMTGMQRLSPLDLALSGEVDIDHRRTVQEGEQEGPVHFPCSSNDSLLKQTFTLVGRTEALSAQQTSAQTAGKDRFRSNRSERG